MNALQRIQNEAARVVTRCDLSKAGHLSQCGWLSVQQIAVYQTCILAHKVIESKSPKYLYQMFTTDYNFNTRQAARLEIRQDMTTPDMELTLASFRWRAVRQYNNLPAVMRQEKSLKIFKSTLWK